MSPSSSKIVLGLGASHTTLMNTQWDAVDHLDRAHSFRNALSTAAQQLADAKPDLIVIVGSNHFRGFWLDLMPPFTIGVDNVSGVGDNVTPSGRLPTDPAAAQLLHQGLLQRDFDIALSSDLEVDHGITHAVQYLLRPIAGLAEVAIVPLVVNVFGPPLPSLRRCSALGSALRQAIHDLPGRRRVAVIATGGLSHQIPFPDWRSPTGPTEEFLANTFRFGRGKWREYEEERRPLIVGAPPRINETFDSDFLDLLAAGDLATFADEIGDEELVQVAGNGGNEIRAWLIMAAALDYRPGRRLAYSAMPEWLTGMAVASIDPSNS